MRTLYNILFPCFFALSSPYYFFRMWRRGSWQSGFGQRFGRYERSVVQRVEGRDVLWLHAVSVGEMNICVELVPALESLKPTTTFIVSTTTTTGMGELQKKLPSSVLKIYYPIDHRRFVARALATIRPKAIVLFEAEIWPNFIWRAMESGIPLFLVNARISDRSFPRYQQFGKLFRPLFDSFRAVGAQSDEYASRLLQIGCRKEAIQVVGNLKFDTAKLHASNSLDVPSLLAQLGVGKTDLVLVCGSTHKGEERILAQQFGRLRMQFRNLFLVLVPRHSERARDVGRIVSHCGLKFVRRSEISPDTSLKPNSIDCLVVDTTGELMSFYEHATLAFIGKSLTAKGGQNPIEPAALSKPTVFGPNMQNFRDVAHILVSQKGAVQVSNPGELEVVFAELLANPARREELGRTAQRIVKENQGAVARTARIIASAR